MVDDNSPKEQQCSIAHLIDGGTHNRRYNDLTVYGGNISGNGTAALTQPGDRVAKRMQTASADNLNVLRMFATQGQVTPTSRTIGALEPLPGDLS